MRAVGLILLGWALGVITPFLLMPFIYQAPQVDWAAENQRIIEMDQGKKRHLPPLPPEAAKGDVQPYEPKLPWPEFRDRPDR